MFFNSEDHIEHDSLNILQFYNIVNILYLDLNVIFPLIQPKPVLSFRKTYTVGLIQFVDI